MGRLGDLGVGKRMEYSGREELGFPRHTTVTNVLRRGLGSDNEAECDGDPRDYATDMASVLTCVVLFFFEHNSINAILILF